jgi:quinoprotein glucose dehydrogenase
MCVKPREITVAGCGLGPFVVALAMLLSPAMRAQQAAGPGRAFAGPADIGWQVPNFDLSATHYSPAAAINPSNVGKLTLKWSSDLLASGQKFRSQATPLVVDGVMYVNVGSKVFAVNGATGQSVWTWDAGTQLGRRGGTYAEGRLYFFSTEMLYALDAKTGQPVESFGNKGRLPVAEAAIAYKYKNTAKDFQKPVLTVPPNYHDGLLYMTMGNSELFIRGSFLVAMDARTGAIKWVFNSIPQGPEDEGWEIAKDTWVSQVRYGGGMWYPPAVDPALKLVYINAANPIPAYEGSSRKGINLFTNCIIALHMDTGKLVWYFQTVHHDIWEFDQVTGPMLYDVTTNGRTVKGLASAGKNCFLYLFNRETGQPLNPIVETAVPTKTDVPGEEMSPTQPFPYTASGVPMSPFCETFPMGMTNPDYNSRRRQIYTPYSTKEFFIVSHGGSSHGSMSFSPRTGLIYVTGKNGAIAHTVTTEGGNRADNRPDAYHQAARDRDFIGTPDGFTQTQTLTAYNAVTGDLVWQDKHATVSMIGSPGNLSTGGPGVPGQR